MQGYLPNILFSVHQDGGGDSFTSKERGNSAAEKQKIASITETRDDVDVLDPSSDPRNPQNWSRLKKGLLFTALMSSSLLADG